MKNTRALILLALPFCINAMTTTDSFFERDSKYAYKKWFEESQKDPYTIYKPSQDDIRFQKKKPDEYQSAISINLYRLRKYETFVIVQELLSSFQKSMQEAAKEIEGFTYDKPSTGWYPDASTQTDAGLFLCCHYDEPEYVVSPWGVHGIHGGWAEHSVWVNSERSEWKKVFAKMCSDAQLKLELLPNRGQPEDSHPLGFKPGEYERCYSIVGFMGKKIAKGTAAAAHNSVTECYLNLSKPLKFAPQVLWAHWDMLRSLHATNVRIKAQAKVCSQLEKVHNELLGKERTEQKSVKQDDDKNGGH